MHSWIVSDNVVSPLGWNTRDNFNAMLEGQSGVRRHERPDLSETSFWAALLDDDDLSERFAAHTGKAENEAWTRFEKMVLLSITEALSRCAVSLRDPETVFILSTTKGNIGLLEENGPNDPDLALHHTARKIAAYFDNPNMPLIVAHACISGVAALQLGKRVLDSGRYKHAVIAGADQVSRFILAGFQSFQALSDEPCRPYDSRRKGLNLGEGCGTLILSTRRERTGETLPIEVLGGAVRNDANHISGPSRTGAELSLAVDRAIAKSNLQASDIDFISAHGTATPFNDEMEAKAFDLSGLGTVPLNSLKGYFGHTLGAAGLIESVLSVESLRSDTVLPTRGFSEPGVSRPVNVCAGILRRPLQFCLKTGSGFGGCNAAVVLGKG